MSTTLKIAAVQMVSGPDLSHNLARARHWLEAAAAQGAQLVSLPEYFCLIGQHDADKLAIAETAGDLNAPVQGMLSRAAKELSLWILAGTLPLRCDTPGKVRNSSCVFAPDGQIAGRYDKMHLFCFDNGRESYDEGRVLERGEHPVAVNCDDWRVGMAVCYDLRFPELFRALVDEAPCDLLSVPAAFTYTTGEKHWELLLRARAVENQAYVLAAAQGGVHPNGRRTWGHSMIVDPWGEVLACVPEGEGLAVAEISRQRLQSVRSQLPALQHRLL